MAKKPGWQFGRQRQRIFQTPDDGYLLAANTKSNDGDVTGNHGDEDWWIVKFAAQGALLKYVTVANGDWNNAATWQGHVVPPDGASIVIRHIVSANVNATCNDLKLESTGNLSVKPGIKITVLK